MVSLLLFHFLFIYFEKTYEIGAQPGSGWGLGVASATSLSEPDSLKAPPARSTYFQRHWPSIRLSTTR